MVVRQLSDGGHSIVIQWSNDGQAIIRRLLFVFFLFIRRSLAKGDLSLVLSTVTGFKNLISINGTFSFGKICIFVYQINIYDKT